MTTQKNLLKARSRKGPEDLEAQTRNVSIRDVPSRSKSKCLSLRSKTGLLTAAFVAGLILFCCPGETIRRRLALAPTMTHTQSHPCFRDINKFGIQAEPSEAILRSYTGKMPKCCPMPAGKDDETLYKMVPHMTGKRFTQLVEQGRIFEYNLQDTTRSWPWQNKENPKHAQRYFSMLGMLECGKNLRFYTIFKMYNETESDKTGVDDADMYDALVFELRIIQKTYDDMNKGIILFELMVPDEYLSRIGNITTRTKSLNFFHRLVTIRGTPVPATSCYKWTPNEVYDFYSQWAPGPVASKAVTEVKNLQRLAETAILNATDNFEIAVRESKEASEQLNEKRKLKQETAMRRYVNANIRLTLMVETDPPSTEYLELKEHVQTLNLSLKRAQDWNKEEYTERECDEQVLATEVQFAKDTASSAQSDLEKVKEAYEVL